MSRTLDVVGIGNALVDVLVETDAAVVAELGLVKGAMSLMDFDVAEQVHARVPGGLQRCGGSAANTIAGLASLGAAVGFIGKTSDDRLGRAFGADIRSLGVALGNQRGSPAPRVPPGEDPPGTGRCLILITPDADRTMLTSLGISALLGPEDIDADLVRRAKFTYLEGYLFDRPEAKEAFRKAIAVAHAGGRRAAMSLSDPFCVDRHHDDFLALVNDGLDLLFGNEEELTMLTGTNDLDAALARLHRPGLIISVTLGARGAMVYDDGEVVEVPANDVPHVVDTTGAGDLYAAGFLYGMCRDLSLEVCARLGSIAAAEIISHVGARPEADLARLAAPLLADVTA